MLKVYAEIICPKIVRIRVAKADNIRNLPFCTNANDLYTSYVCHLVC